MGKCKVSGFIYMSNCFCTKNKLDALKDGFFYSSWLSYLITIKKFTTSSSNYMGKTNIVVFDELERLWNEGIAMYLVVLPQHVCGETEEN